MQNQNIIPLRSCLNTTNPAGGLCETHSLEFKQIIKQSLMFLRLIGQAIVPYKFSAELTKIQDYLWQHSDTTSNHQFLYWGYCIVFGIVSRLLMLISEATDKTRSFGAKLIEPAFFFLLAFGVEELVFQYYFSGSINILAAILVALAYFKMRGMSIKVTYDQGVD